MAFSRYAEQANTITACGRGSMTNALKPIDRCAQRAGSSLAALWVHNEKSCLTILPEAFEHAYPTDVAVVSVSAQYAAAGR
jgi:hypothetical protein